MKMLDTETALLTYWEEQDAVCNKPVPSPCWVSSLYMKRGDKCLNVSYQQTQIQKIANGNGQTVVTQPANSECLSLLNNADS